MSGRQEIDIEISPDGEVSLKVRCVAGQACVDLTRALEEELGIVVEREKTSEYYQDAVSTGAAVKIGGDPEPGRGED